MGNERPGSDDALPTCASLADLMRLDGQRVRLQGLYDVARVEGSKRLQPVTVRLDDGAALLRSYRPVPDELRYLERRVLVVGVVSSGLSADPTVQQVVAPSVSPDQIQLCPGEAAAQWRGAEVPAPPRVADADALAGRAGLWVRAAGTLEAVAAPEDDPWWADARLRLADGAVVEIATVPASRWEPLEGGEVVVTGRVMDAGAGEPRVFELEGPTAVEER